MSEPRDLVPRDELVSALLDGELSADQSSTVAAALAADPALARRRDELAAVRRAVRDLPPVDPPPGVIDRLVLDLRRPHRPRSQVVATWGAAAAAAVLVVAIAPAARSAGELAPDVDEMAARHEVVATDAISSTRPVDDPADDPGADDPEGQEPASEEFVAADLAEVGAGDAVPSSLGGEDPAAVFVAGETTHVVYGEGDGATSLFVEPGEVDWDDLEASGGDVLSVDGDRAWRTTVVPTGRGGGADAVAVAVVEREGVVFVVVGAAASDPDALVALPAPDGAWSDDLADACGGAVQTLGFDF